MISAEENTSTSNPLMDSGMHRLTSPISQALVMIAHGKPCSFSISRMRGLISFFTSLRTVSTYSI